MPNSAYIVSYVRAHALHVGRTCNTVFFDSCFEIVQFRFELLLIA